VNTNQDAVVVAHVASNPALLRDSPQPWRSLNPVEKSSDPHLIGGAGREIHKTTAPGLGNENSSGFATGFRRSASSRLKNAQLF
jgi:hypothetical protein